MSLRPYQTRAVDAIERALRPGHPVLFVCPTGGGKTRTAGAVLERASRPCAVVHTATLRDQVRDRLGPGVAVHTIQGLLASGASLSAHDVVWLDEAHHYVGSSWEAVWDRLGLGTAVLGVTATPARADGVGLGERFRSLVHTANYSDLVRGGYLTPCDVRRTAPDPVAAYLQHGRGAPGVIFLPTKSKSREAIARLQEAGVPGATIDADTSDRERRRIVADYTQGRLQVLASPAALSEGFDAPRAEVCVMGRACHHEAMFLQCAGRVLRPHPGKARALLLDCTGASERHGNPTTDRVYSLTGQGIRRKTPTPAQKRRQTPTGWWGGFWKGLGEAIFGC